MPTTTNYGWTTPADTDLVKDGAAAIRTLGSSIDTTLKTQIDAQIPDSLLTTKGDIIAATGASTPARLGVGTNGQALIADSTAATGLKWDTPAAGGMTLISSTTLTGASVTLSSIPQIYNSLKIYVQNFLPATSNASLFIRANGDSGANRYITIRFNEAPADNVGFNEQHWKPDRANSNSVARGFMTLDLWDYTNTTTWKMITGFNVDTNQTTSTNFNWSNIQGYYNQLPAITSLTFLPSSGNFTSGTLLLYGVK